MSHQPNRIVPHVDHRAPIHDATCRCPICKPSFNQDARDANILAALIICCPIGLVIWGIIYSTLRLAGWL